MLGKHLLIFKFPNFLAISGQRGVAKFVRLCTMVENREKHRQNSHLIIQFPMSEEVSEVSERASE